MSETKLESSIACVPPVVVEEAWSAFVAKKSVDRLIIRDEIATSWDRCLSFELDPLSGPPHILSNDEIMDRNRLLLTVAIPHMNRLLEFLQRKGYIAILLSPDGCILSLLGDKKMSSYAESLNVYPGVNNAEKYVGTTAPGISIARGIAIQVHKQEHYCQWSKNWCCSSSPIFNDKHELVGVLDVSNIELSLHTPEILNFVTMVAKAIEVEYNYRFLQNDYKTISSYFSAFSNAHPDALVVIDTNDKIIHINNNLQRLLGRSAANFVGCDAQTVFSNYGLAKNGLNAGRQWTELHFNTGSRIIKFDAQLKMLQPDLGGTSGVVGVLKKKQSSENNQHQTRYSFQDFVFSSKHMRSIIDDATRMAATDHTILIQGETGTGKEVLAQAIHNSSPRRGCPFVAINCAGLPKDLIQAELFGYESGSFTGADKNGKPGKFELAEGGTIFLDEIGDMPLEAQANLLRVLQEKYIVRVGGLRPVKVDVRVTAATNRNLFQEVAAGQFRSDLFYRLSVISLHLLPLRERREDIWPLVEHFVDKHSTSQTEIHEILFSKQARSALLTYGWPGNIRELENTVAFALTKMSNYTITIKELPDNLSNFSQTSALTDDLHSTERRAIEDAIQRCGGNISNVAEQLGISRSTLYRKLKRYSIKETE
jgi:transcriptional regulator of acetoin/glycerol metabolism